MSETKMTFNEWWASYLQMTEEDREAEIIRLATVVRDQRKFENKMINDAKMMRKLMELRRERVM